jgi:hypothetical protein
MSIYSIFCIRFSQRCEFVSDLIRYQNAYTLSMNAMEEQEQFSFKVKLVKKILAKS